MGAQITYSQVKTGLSLTQKSTQTQKFLITGYQGYHQTNTSCP